MVKRGLTLTCPAVLYAPQNLNKDGLLRRRETRLIRGAIRTANVSCTGSCVTVAVQTLDCVSNKRRRVAKRRSRSRSAASAGANVFWNGPSIKERSNLEERAGWPERETAFQAPRSFD